MTDPDVDWDLVDWDEDDDLWEYCGDASRWEPPPEPVVPPPWPRLVTPVRVYAQIPPEATEAEKWQRLRDASSCHNVTALVEGLCPKCYARLHRDPEDPHGWGRCPDLGHGRWRREPIRPGDPNSSVTEWEATTVPWQLPSGRWVW